VQGVTISDEQMRRVGTMVAGWSRPLLLTHAHPDGDALGCLVAMRSILRNIGSDPLSMLFEGPPAKYDLLTTPDPFPIWGGSVEESDLEMVDGVLVMDTCTYNQLGPIADWLGRNAGSRSRPVIAMDHHQTRDDLADEYLVDESAAAACEILYRWSTACGWSLDDPAARALYVGIATDTGWFRFSNTRPVTLEIAAELVRRGVSPDETYGLLFQNESAARVRLLGAALNALELHHGGRLAVLPVSKAMFEHSGAVGADTEGIVNEPLRIAGVEVSVLLAESCDETTGPVKVSLRSKGGVNVATVAASLGGGGHERAAGVRIAGTLEGACAKVLSELDAAER